jgi:hypothetical protein
MGKVRVVSSLLIHIKGQKEVGNVANKKNKIECY